MAGFGTFLVSLAGPAIRKVMLSLGLGVASYAAVAVALDGVISNAKAAWGGIGGDALSLIQISGVNTALSVICGALIARVGLMALKKIEILS